MPGEPQPARALRTLAARAGWLGVEIRHLAAFVAVADLRSFRGAATRLGYTPSAVSQLVSQLEELLDVRLLERAPGRRRVSVTEPGQLLLIHLQSVVNQFQAASADLEAMRPERAGTVRMSIHPGLAASLAAQLVGSFADAFPELDLVLCGAGTDTEVAESLAAGLVDVAICASPATDLRFGRLTVVEDPYVLLTARDSHLARSGRAPALGELEDLALLGHDLMSHVTTQLRARGVEPRVGSAAPPVSAVQSLVGSGAEAAILPRLAVRPGDPHTVALSLDALLAPLPVSLMWLRGRHLGHGLQRLRELVGQLRSELTVDTTRGRAA